MSIDASVWYLSLKELSRDEFDVVRGLDALAHFQVDQDEVRQIGEHVPLPQLLDRVHGQLDVVPRREL